MHLDGDLALIHQPVRLSFMTLLWRHRDISYTHARDTLGLTDGNLANHARRLEEAGFVEARRVLQGREGFTLRYQLTPTGHATFRAYLDRLRDVLQEAGETANTDA